MRVASLFVVLAMLSSAWGQQHPKTSDVRIDVSHGRLGTASVSEMAEKTTEGKRQFTTEITFDMSGRNSFQETRIFCGNLQKRLDRYWFKLVRIKSRQENTGTDGTFPDFF